MSSIVPLFYYFSEFSSMVMKMALILFCTKCCMEFYLERASRSFSMMLSSSMFGGRRERASALSMRLI